VTLEPCNHTGRTGPCAQALLDAGVRRVVYGQPDPNPLASGGAAMLAASGLSVEGLVLADGAEQLNDIWTRAMQLQRPFVTWKVASTVDGRVAAPDGSSRWITSLAARAEVHELRAKVDAVVVGTGTVWTDDPELTARDHDGVPHARQPLRVVIGKRDLPSHSRVLDESFETVHLRTHDLDAALKALFERDVHHVLLEGGPTLAAAVLAAGLVDQAIGYIAPALFGGGTSMVAPLPVRSVDEAVRFEFDDVRLVGGDLRWSASPGSLVTDGLRE
jgi:diaminohydroxyphosphoribosylaminopyrimidine deaminase/5-amino-6-(5-phosphoribosylamino)uracil reductase